MFSNKYSDKAETFGEKIWLSESSFSEEHPSTLIAAASPYYKTVGYSLHVGNDVFMSCMNMNNVVAPVGFAVAHVEFFILKFVPLVCFSV